MVIFKPVEKRIRYETKEEANARREREFMALAPEDRLQWFLRSFDERPLGDPEAAARKGNFVIRKRNALR
jgi:hypothetical protein